MREDIVRVDCSDPDAEREKVEQLRLGMQEARKRAGNPARIPDAATFHQFIKTKIKELKDKLGCEKVQFSIAVEQGAVKFRAMKAK